MTDSQYFSINIFNQGEQEKIEKNPGLRSLAKLFLNSFWGKFGQPENMKKKSIVRTCEELYDLVFDPEIEITEFVPINKDSIIVNWIRGGPKFYTYVVKKPDGSTAECCKLKGVKLNVESSELINYNTVRSLVIDNIDPFHVQYKCIRRDQYHQVLTKKETKIIRATGPKRRRVGVADSFPYGYKRAKKE